MPHSIDDTTNLLRGQVQLCPISRKKLNIISHEMIYENQFGKDVWMELPQDGNKIFSDPEYGICFMVDAIFPKMNLSDR